jgi:hypothetical protein
MRRRLARCVSLAAFALPLAGCAEEAPSLPAACRESPEAIRGALAEAPGAVTIRGVRLSECLSPSSDPADVQAVGATYVEVAATLASDSRKGSDPRSAEQLGYLIGAVRRGAAGTQGIHEELVRRLEQELGGVDVDSDAFVRGGRAGRAGG